MSDGLALCCLGLGHFRAVSRGEGFSPGCC